VVLRGKKPDTLCVNKRVVSCPDEVEQHLEIPAGSDVFLLKRNRYVDEDAVSIEDYWVPAHLINDVDAIGISLYDYFSS
ncbi:UTRA domain-containing protein, partial [Salmonella enterica]|uniref:UTRA domain-containing protein n=1 Tax=Salmonella enterica TaxID=28901 RepID=UPI00329A07D4